MDASEMWALVIYVGRTHALNVRKGRGDIAFDQNLAQGIMRFLPSRLFRLLAHS